MTERLFRMTAALHGQAWNASQVGRALGLSYHTVNAYMEFLTGAFLLRLLPPFHANLKKRLVKSPKLYWRDAGLLHALLGAASREELLSRPWAVEIRLTASPSPEDARRLRPFDPRLPHGRGRRRPLDEPAGLPGPPLILPVVDARRKRGA